jgi:hypothetical protein
MDDRAPSARTASRLVDEASTVSPHRETAAIWIYTADDVMRFTPSCDVTEHEPPLDQGGVPDEVPSALVSSVSTSRTHVRR